MNKYICEKCSKFFSQKSHYDKHKNRKKSCEIQTDKIKELINKAIEEKLNELNKKIIFNNRDNNITINMMKQSDISKMSKLELDLPRLLEDLRVYTDLIKLIDEKEKDKTELDDFRDIRNNKSQLSDLVNKVNIKIQANIDRQNLIFQILYKRVQIPLLARLNY